MSPKQFRQAARDQLSTVPQPKVSIEIDDIKKGYWASKI
jgi:hypothetical protein